MRRQIAFLPVFIMMICGCNKADDDTAPYDSVRFDVQTESSTRGSVIGGTTLPATETFRVYAWKTVGSETTVMMTRDAADQESNVVSNQQGVWTTKRRYYWPTDDGATVSFYAFYPKDHAVVKNGDDVSVDFTIPTAVADQYDMMAAKCENQSLAGTTGGAAPLRFHHLMSQVSFRARLAPAFTGWQVAVRGIRLCNVNSRGTYHYSGAGTLSPASPAVRQDYDLVMAAPVAVVSSVSESVPLTSTADVAMLMPQSLTAWDRTTETASSGAPSTAGCYIAINCTITDSDGNLAFSGNTYVPLAPEWQKACHYNYLLEFGSGYQGDGEVTVNNIGIVCTISDWVPGNTGDVNIEQD